jgi:4-azaleucine resistance transporter AzlC
MEHASTQAVPNSAPSREFISGVRDVSPILLGVVPFGMIFGVLALEAGLPGGVAQAMSSVIFAGSAQFITVQLIGQSTPWFVIVVTGAIVNIRHMLYSASVAPHTKHLPLRWKALLAYLLTDEAYAIAITRYLKPDNGGTHGHWYFLGAGITLWSSWQLSTAVGLLLGALVPPSWSLDFTLALTFIAIVVPALNDRGTLAAALVAGVLAVVAFSAPLKIGLIIAVVAGIAAGLVTEWVD